MLRLYVVRHGETEWNIQKRMQGRLDSSLTKKGKTYARLLSEKLKNIHFDKIYSSPSKRAMDTAQILKRDRNIPINQDKLLMEMDMGPWQGKTENEIKELFPEDYLHFWNHPDRFQGNGGESFEDVKKRANDFLVEVTREENSGNILVVTHGILINSLYLIFRGHKDFRLLWDDPFIEGTSLTIVEVEQNQYRFLLEADMGHANPTPTITSVSY